MLDGQLDVGQKKKLLALLVDRQPGARTDADAPTTRPARPHRTTGIRAAACRLRAFPAGRTHAQRG